MARLVEEGVVAVLDVVLLTRDLRGRVRVVDDDLGAVGLHGLDVGPVPLVATGDLAAVLHDLDPGTSAAVVVLRHTWAGPVTAALAAAGGRVVTRADVPPAVVAAAAEQAAGTVDLTAPADLTGPVGSPGLAASGLAGAGR